MKQESLFDVGDDSTPIDVEAAAEMTSPSVVAETEGESTKGRQSGDDPVKRLVPKIRGSAVSEIEQVEGGGPCSRMSTEAGDGMPAFRPAPHEVFLAWSERQQLLYCAACDRDSARIASEHGEDPEFYLARAADYERDAADV